MTLQELQAETLSEKSKRIRQSKCAHEDTYTSSVQTREDVFTNSFCWDCGAVWHLERKVA